RCQNAGGAESALDGVMLAECYLQGAEPVALAQALHGCNVHAVRLHCKHQARAHRRAVGNDRAGATHAVLTAGMGAGELQVMTQAVGKRSARLDCCFVGHAVDRKARDLSLAHALSFRASFAADESARSVSTWRSARR